MSKLRGRSSWLVGRLPASVASGLHSGRAGPRWATRSRLAGPVADGAATLATNTPCPGMATLLPVGPRARFPRACTARIARSGLRELRREVARLPPPCRSWRSRPPRATGAAHLPVAGQHAAGRVSGRRWPGPEAKRLEPRDRREPGEVEQHVAADPQLVRLEALHPHARLHRV